MEKKVARIPQNCKTSDNTWASSSPKKAFTISVPVRRSCLTGEHKRFCFQINKKLNMHTILYCSHLCAPLQNTFCSIISVRVKVQSGHFSPHKPKNLKVTHKETVSNLRSSLPIPFSPFQGDPSIRNS